MKRSFLPSLKLTIPMLLIGFSLILLLVFYNFSLPRTLSVIENKGKDHLFQRISHLQGTLEYLMRHKDTTGLQREVAALASQEEYKVVVLVDSNGNILASTRRVWLGKPVAEVEALADFDADEATQAVKRRIAHVVTVDDGNALAGYAGIAMTPTAAALRSDNFGQLYFKYDLKVSKLSARRQLLQQSFTWVLTISGLALLLWLAFHLLLTRRAEKLIGTAELLANGELSVRSNLTGSDELARLSHAFDTMAGRIQQTQQEREHSEAVFREAALGISQARSEGVFDSLVTHLSKAVGTDFALIGVLGEENQIHTRALYAHGSIEENISYPLDGSPCANVVGQQFRFYPDTIQQRFPDDHLLREIDMESYAAIPLTGTSGNVLGLLAVLDGQPLQDATLIESILQIFAGRAASELEREQADAALRASEASYRAIFEASEDSIFVHHLETGAILDVNKKTCDTYGYSKKELRQIDVGELSSGVSPYTKEDAGKLIKRAVDGELLRFEWHRKNRDGSLHWDEVYLKRASIGGHERLLAFTREITKRKEADEKLRASEAQYREANRKLLDSEAFKSAIVENSLLSVITINEAGTIVEFNPAAVEMFGYNRNLAIGSLLSELIIPEAHRKAHTEGLARYLRTGEAHILGKRLELSALRADGSNFPVELSISTTRIGDANYFTAFIADLSEKKDAEATIRASEEQYRSIFNTASDAMILWDAKGKMVDANPAAWEMGGYTKQEFLGIPFHEHIHPSSVASFNQFKSDVGKYGAAKTETRAIRKNGAIIDLDSRSIPMPYQGQPHILTVIRDVTEQKKIAEELARQRETLRQSEKLSAMGELLAGVAHELNNPLAILMGRTALLENKVKDPAVKEEVKKIHVAAERCGRIVRAFLSMARQKPPEHTSANLTEVVASAVDLLAYGLGASDINLETRLSKKLPEQRMDADQIGQVVINLLINAQHILVEQAEPRHIIIETRASSSGVFCRVTDNGPGVADDLRQRIFDPFFTTKEASMGTGIGLSVSRGIAREHKGDLRLLETKQGASFELYLPFNVLDIKASTADKSLPRKKSQSGHVLIVDDEPEITEMLAEILQSAGLETTQMHCGKDALQWLERHSCDMILSDIRMLDIDGPALWRVLEEKYPELLKHTAFITGDTLSAAIAPFLKETHAPLLEKPFTPEQVLTLVAQVEPVI